MSPEWGIAIVGMVVAALTGLGVGFILRDRFGK